ncbi:TAXI family TRAP transporter solute-binding subunit, partial [Geminicoccus flavidas]|uniref:TAXI family TRAP transporter solute-binding subunit n=1 Tax=Geminicoccus flavidas TaxID=2506407 RepID=UPI001F1CB2DE
YLVTHSDVPDETAYQMTAQLFAHLDQLASAHAAAKAIRLEDALNGMPLPLHPGAERFYDEKGMKR